MTQYISMKTINMSITKRHKKMNFRGIITIVFTCFLINLFAQPINNEVGDIVPPSPNVAAINKYTDIPVSKFTGVPNISIPIYTIQEGPIQVPISLSYHAGGIKLGETASWVGLGWNLSTGGMVSRSIIGKADDDKNGRGYMSDQYRTSGNFVGEVVDGISDGEADIFNISFGGYSGKMVWSRSEDNGNGGWYIYPLSDLKVETIHNDGPEIEGFLFTTPKGIKYLFGMGEFEYTDVSTNRTINDPHFDPFTADKTAWYLKEIRSPDDKYIVTYSYAPEEYKYKVRGSNYNITEISQAGSNGACNSGSQTEPEIYHILIRGKQLTSISTTRAGFEVKFNQGDYRYDLEPIVGNNYPVASHPAKVLNNIEIFEGNQCKSFEFTFDYFGKLNTYSEEKRLKLLKVQEKACLGSTAIPPYSFIYEDKINDVVHALPSRISKQIDHWGYYNGAAANENKPTLIPYTAIIELDDGRILEYLGGDPNHGANRNVNGDYMKLASLKQITYPTGGVDIFDLGPNIEYGPRRDRSTDELHARWSSCGLPNFEQQFTASFSDDELASATYEFSFDEDRDTRPAGCDCNDNGRVGAAVSTFTDQIATPSSSVSDQINFPSCEYIQRGEHPLTSNFDPPLQSNVDYEFSVGEHPDASFQGDVTCHFRIRYIPEENHEAGGLRVNRITRIRNGEAEVTNFNYNHSDGTSSGEILIEPKYGYLIHSNYGNGIFSVLKYFTSSPLTNTADINGYFFGYKEVSTQIDDVKSTYKYELFKQDNTIFPIIPAPIHYYNGTQIESLDFLDGTVVERKKEYFGEEFITQNGNYEDDSQLKVFKHVCGSINYITTVTFFTEPPGYYRLNSTVETTDGLATSTNYTYGGSHLEPIKVAISGPGASQITSYKFAEDLNDQLLLDRYMITIPLETKINGGEGGGSKTAFKEEQGYIVPHEFYRWNDDSGNWEWVARHINYTSNGLPQTIEKRGFDASKPIIEQNLTWQDRLLTSISTGRLASESRTQYFDYYFDGHRQLKSLITADGQSTYFKYDALWRLVEEDINREKIINTYTYNYQPFDGRNSVYKGVKVRDANYAFDTEQRYDAFGQPIASIKHDYTASEADWVESQVFNAHGSVINKCDPAQGSCYTYTYYPSTLQRLHTETQGNWPKSVSYEYGAESNLFMTKRISEDNVETKTLTDGLSRTRKTIDGLGQPTSYDYDGRGNILSINGPAGTYSYSYDGLGRLLSKTVPDGGMYSYTYYDNDLLKTTTDPKGQSTTNEYNIFGELENVYSGTSTSGNPISSYTYGNGVGNAGKMLTSNIYKSRGGQVQKTYSYDQYGRVTNESVSTGYLGMALHHVEIDNADFVKTTNRSGGIVHDMSYDHGGRPISTATNWNNTTINTFNEYNDNDWRTVHYLGGTENQPLQKVNFGYNERSWLENINAIQQILDRETNGTVPTIDEDDLIQILIDFETGYDITDILNCSPTNLRLEMDGVVNILTGEKKGSYPFSKEKEIPLFGGKSNTTFTTISNYNIQGVPDANDIIKVIQGDVATDAGVNINDSNIACQDCSFEAYIADDVVVINGLSINGQNILNDEYNFHYPPDRIRLEDDLNSWLLNNNGGGQAIVEYTPEYSGIRFENVSVAHDFEYMFMDDIKHKIYSRAFFVSPLTAEPKCELTCDYHFTDARLLDPTTGPLKSIGSGKKGIEFPFLYFSSGDNRVEMKKIILDYLNLNGYFYQQVVVRTDGIDVIGTNAPFDELEFYTQSQGSWSFRGIFTRTCEPMCEAGLLCWIEEVLPGVISDFFDVDIFEDFNPTCLEDGADPSTCLDCPPCPQLCDLFAEEIYYEQEDPNINATPWYAGNISHIKWTTSYGGLPQSYTYNYDANDRMLTALSGKYAPSFPGQSNHQWSLNSIYDVAVSYDGAGNIQSINRSGVTERLANGALNFGPIDNLSLTYGNGTKPNQLTGITESPDPEFLNKGFKPFGGAMPSSGVISYDANGNMTENNYKGITEIQYDLYNFPKLITFDDNSTIEMDYDAEGNKLWMKVSRPGEVNKEFAYLNGMVVSSTDESLYADGGRITDASGDFRAEYVISDHLGNGRVWFADLNEDGKIRCDHSEILQEENYYPFGMAQEGIWQNDPNDPDPLGIPVASEENDRYTYNGKEIENDLTGWLDYGARWYDPSLGLFMKQDRFAEKYVSISPYSYGAGNPIKYIDINGDSLDIFGPDGTHFYTFDDGKESNTGLYFQNSSKDKNGGTTFSDGISFSYNDEAEDRADAISGHLSVTFASDADINSKVDAGIRGMDGSLNNTMKEGANGGTIDYNSGPFGVDSYKLTITKSKEGGTLAYNVADYANYLTGLSLRKLGYASEWTGIFGHGNNIINGPSDHGSRARSGWLDSKADQRALRNGYGHFQAIPNFNPQFPTGYKL